MEQNQLPKNIRQIGQVVKEPKIYIEDYVMTFARKMAEKNKNGQGMAVLLGKREEDSEKHPVFIKGAVEICGWEEQKGLLFDNEIWSNIYEGVKNYFPDMGIVGWMTLRLGQELGFDEKVKAIHEQNFMESGNILFVFDKEEKEEYVYRYENLEFAKQSGYYIYYEKNEPMQDYMIDVFGNKSEERPSEDRVIEQVRELVSNKDSVGRRGTNNVIYAASTALAAVILVIGVTTLNNYDKMESMEKTLNHISANIEEQEQKINESKKNELELVVETVTGTVEGVEESKSDGQLTVTNEEEVSMTDEDEKDENLVEETAADVKYYVVQKGDTLGSICTQIYGSLKNVELIREMNQIDNVDMIYEGQKLVVP